MLRAAFEASVQYRFLFTVAENVEQPDICLCRIWGMHMAKAKLPSSVQVGNEFRDQVCSLLAAAGFRNVTPEVRIDSKKIDAYSEWLTDTMFGTKRVILEAKNFQGTLSKTQCSLFATEYNVKITNNYADHAWLISKNPISPDGRKLIREHRNLECFTYAELQRRLFNVDGYLQVLLQDYSERQTAVYYVPPHTKENHDVEKLIRQWLKEDAAPPLAIVGSYGSGKTTFARHLAATLAQEAIDDATKRAPILIPLGEIVDEQAISGLLGKVLASDHRVANYHFSLFKALNHAGRFVVIFDGLDEMKHGMTFPRFQQSVAQLLELDAGDARVLMLGRDTAFRDDAEFRAIIGGRETTAAGQDVPSYGRRPARHLVLRDFTGDEAKQFVEHFFPIEAASFAREHKIRSIDPAWVSARLAEMLSEEFGELILRPVHAQMLCIVASDPKSRLSSDRFDLYDKFVHHLIAREVGKPGRYSKFDVGIRRRFNAGVAWWLWQAGLAASTTFSDIPREICLEVTRGVKHDFDDVGLARELTTGCLVHKAGNTVHFGHRSIQEFLAAEHVVAAYLLSEDPRVHATRWWSMLKTMVVSEFIVERVKRLSPYDQARVASRALESLHEWRSDDGTEDAVLHLFVNLFGMASLDEEKNWQSPWLLVFGFFHKNGKTTFSPTDAGLEYARKLLSVPTGLQTGGRRMAPQLSIATVLYIWTCIIQQESIPTRLASEFCASCIPVKAVEEFERSGKDAGTFMSVYPETELLFWAFLSAFSTHATDSKVGLLDPNKLLRAARRYVRFGLLDMDKTYPEVQVSMEDLRNALADRVGHGRARQMCELLGNNNKRRRFFQCEERLPESGVSRR